MFLAGNVGESPNLKGLGSLEKIGKLFLANVNFSVVHEFEQCLHVLLPDVPQDHDRMLTWVRLQQNQNQNFGYFPENYNIECLERTVKFSRLSRIGLHFRIRNYHFWLIHETTYVIGKHRYYEYVDLKLR